ncbi:transcription factor NIGTH1-like isoform X1 [Musa acuminata AAA Group]|uniref:transcription factor NIGTH1 isoform X1 n=2 Tax=Musa acuminata AAA Group TaxID=214697 RepID=UPI0031E2AD60
MCSICFCSLDYSSSVSGSSQILLRHLQHISTPLISSRLTDQRRESLQYLVAVAPAMGSPPELSLDYKLDDYTAVAKAAGAQPEQNQKIQEFLARLEEERHKIEVFKRELPLCMQLLNNAIEIYKQQLQERVPLKYMNVDGSDKANWMVSAQLWSPPDDAAKQQAAPPPKEADVIPKLALDTTKQRSGGAFLPFSREKSRVAHATSAEKVVEEKKCAELENEIVNTGRHSGANGHENTADSQAAAAAAPPTHRKARRCWSPDLHRRFVNALQMLGGSQVATPKQIRELMKVDGLTNDEVKSHLQKYRLHTRRPIPAPHAAVGAGAPPQLVVLGGIWVPPEYATSAGPAMYGAHAAPVPREFYSPVPHHHYHHLHYPPLGLGASTPAASRGRTADSPEPEVRSGGERSESIEEEEEEVRKRDEEEEEEEAPASEEKALVPLMVKAEDDNGGDVVLKI